MGEIKHIKINPPNIVHNIIHDLDIDLLYMFDDEPDMFVYDLTWMYNVVQFHKYI